jgi:hypothetical protein
MSENEGKSRSSGSFYTLGQEELRKRLKTGPAFRICLRRNEKVLEKSEAQGIGFKAANIEFRDSGEFFSSLL